MDRVIVSILAVIGIGRPPPGLPGNGSQVLPPTGQWLPPWAPGCNGSQSILPPCKPECNGTHPALPPWLWAIWPPAWRPPCPTPPPWDPGHNSSTTGPNDNQTTPGFPETTRTTPIPTGSGGPPISNETTITTAGPSWSGSTPEASSEPGSTTVTTLGPSSTESTTESSSNEPTTGQPTKPTDPSTESPVPTTSDTTESSIGSSGPTTGTTTVPSEPSTGSTTTQPLDPTTEPATEPSTGCTTVPSEPTTEPTTIPSEPITGSSAEPSDPSTEPATEATEPSTGSTTVPSEPSTGSTTVPSEPSTGSTTVPSEPITGSSTEPSDPSTEPATEATEPSTGSTTVPSEPTTGSTTVPSEPTTGPTTIPSEPVTGSSTEPSDPSTEPATEAIEPSTGSTTVASESTTGSTTVPSEPTTGPTTIPSEPVTGSSTEPSDPSTEPATEATEPSTGSTTVPTEPSTESPKPTTQPTEPSTELTTETPTVSSTDSSTSEEITTPISPEDESSSASLPFDNPHFVPKRSGIVHLLEWKFLDIAKECEDFLGPKGFAAVQTSPVNENLIITGRPWYERYQPISYDIRTRSGDAMEFLEMTQRCLKAGIRIYVDVVPNHMTANAPAPAKGTAGSVADPNRFLYPAVPYNASHFHQPTCQITDFNDPKEARVCELVGLHDLNQTLPHVQITIANFLNYLTALGAAGFRVDAAKYIHPEDLKKIYNRLSPLSTVIGFAADSYPFVYQDVGDSWKFNYTQLGAVTEYSHATNMAAFFKNELNASALQNYGGPHMGMLPHRSALVFVDNHDLQRQNVFTLNYKSPREYRAASAFTLAHPYGIPRIMSSFDFKSDQDGPPHDKSFNIKSPSFDSNGQCRNGWICEHRWNAIVNMIAFRNKVANSPLQNFWSDDARGILAFSRGKKGFFIMSSGKSSFNERVQTHLPPGVYCNSMSQKRVTARCESSSRVVIRYDGTAQINLPRKAKELAVALHTGNLIKSSVYDEDADDFSFKSTGLWPVGLFK